MSKRKALQTLNPNRTVISQQTVDTDGEYQLTDSSADESDYVPISTKKKGPTQSRAQFTAQAEGTPPQGTPPQGTPPQGTPPQATNQEPAPSNTSLAKKCKPKRKRVKRTEVAPIPPLDREKTLRWFLDLPDVKRYNLREKLVKFIASGPFQPQEPTVKPPSSTSVSNGLVDNDDIVFDSIENINNLAMDPGLLAKEVVDGLQAHIPTWWPSTDPDIDLRWDEFVASESQFSDDSDEGSHLVKPSGTLAANLLIQWHYPTFSTTASSFGVCADNTNPCLHMMFKKFQLQLTDSSSILAYDTICRRFNLLPLEDRRSWKYPYDTKSKSWHLTHEAFSRWIWEQSRAKVALILGKQNAKAVERSSRNYTSLAIRPLT